MMKMDNFPKYPKIFNLGDPLLENLFKGSVIVEEKVDGSQFRVWFDEKSELWFGSKGVVYSDERLPDKMFEPAILQATKHLKNITYHGENALLIFEFLAKPKQNSLTYSRTPTDNLVLLDVSVGGKWLSRNEKEKFAKFIGFECIPILKEGEFKTAEELETLLETQSFLGNTVVEGIVIKNYTQMHSKEYLFGQPVFGKYVRKEFRELNKKTWNVGKTIDEQVMEHFPKEQRWKKVVQHLRDAGELGNGVKDIGKLVKAVENDFEEESEEFVKKFLWDFYKYRLKKMIRRGFAEWYKKKLLEESFEKA